MKSTYSSFKDTKNFQISVPLTVGEKRRLNKLKKETGKAIGYFTRDAIIEKLKRDFPDDSGDAA